VALPLDRINRATRHLQSWIRAFPPFVPQPARLARH